MNRVQLRTPTSSRWHRFVRVLATGPGQGRVNARSRVVHNDRGALAFDFTVGITVVATYETATSTGTGPKCP